MNEVRLVRRDKRRYADRRQYLIAAVSKRRKKIREMAFEYKGDKCERCGYNQLHGSFRVPSYHSSEKILVFPLKAILVVGRG